MEKILRFAAWTGAALILLGIVSCNLPFFTPGDDGPTVATAVPGNPDAPTNTDGAETILIPWGTFWMGSEESDTLAGEDERPRHQVTLNGFYLYTHEVTNEMYAECVAAGACLPINMMESGPTTHYGDVAYADYPVVGVDWNMADDYCTWAGGRLPTEAEWERAARGEESLLYPWGAEDPACERVNMLGCAVPPDTVEVGSYLLGNSPEGVWDMSGNVWEWVHDWYDEEYYPLSSSFNPLGPYSYEEVNNPLKSVRGGGLYSGPEQMRTADRAGTNPYRAYDDVGFRCVAEGEVLPADYIPPLDRHEMVPPDPLDGGGEPLDDPDDTIPWYSIGWSEVSCPSPDGRMFLVVEADSSEAVTYAVTVDGVPFDCTYDEMLRLLQCEGPVPETTEYPGEYHVQVHSLPSGGIGHVYPDIPTDCDTFTPDRFSMDLNCPEDGLFNITFAYEPAITWDIVQISGVNIPCVASSGTEIWCTAPDLPVGDHYEFYLHGTDEAGAEYEWMPWAPVLHDCPVNFNAVDLAPFCFEGHPTVQVTYNPDAVGAVTLFAGEAALNCIGMAPGVKICGDLIGAPGEAVEVGVFIDGAFYSTETVTVPECPDSGLEPGFIFEPYCYPPEAPAPAVSIHYWPFDRHLVTATVGDTAVTCTDWGGGWYVCPGVPGTDGETIEISACLEDGTCFNGPMTIPNCGSTGEDDWRMNAIGCHDETRIYFMIDTGLAWLISGADFDYTASDGETTYACTVNPAVPGRIYCSGTRPESPGPLEFCLQRAGEPSPTCQIYPNYNIWVTAIPPCLEITAEPVDPCSVHTTSNTCWADKPACGWVLTPTPHCESVP